MSTSHTAVNLSTLLLEVGARRTGCCCEFTAREDDGTGLYYYRARYYHSALGRFASEDPLRFVGGPNFYAYAQNDPLALRDPLGLVTEEECRERFNGCMASVLEQTKKFGLEQTIEKAIRNEVVSTLGGGAVGGILGGGAGAKVGAGVMAVVGAGIGSYDISTSFAWLNALARECSSSYSKCLGRCEAK